MVYNGKDPKAERTRLEQEIKEMQNSIISKQYQLDSISKTCAHTWGSTTYDPIVREGYMDPGDAPGTMGVDWRGPQWIPRHETARWKRTCTKCGKVEYTQSYNEKTVKEPKF